ncbi:MAG TPA: hypothetical protein VIH76_15095 [Candidatus Acidoferrales bacterium]
MKDLPIYIETRQVFQIEVVFDIPVRAVLVGDTAEFCRQQIKTSTIQLPMSRKQLDLIEESYFLVANLNGTLANFSSRAKPVSEKEIKKPHSAKKAASFDHAPGSEEGFATRGCKVVPLVTVNGRKRSLLRD